MKSIGFIGVGNMGAPMARRLIQAGFELTVCDASPQALERFKDLAVKTTLKPTECAICEIVIVMVTTDGQVKDVVLGSEGILHAVIPDRPPLIAVMSTVLPRTIQELAKHCAAKNVPLLDAPVSGVPIAAKEGRLSIFVGGEEKDLSVARPIFEVMGTNIYHIGRLGFGEVVKLINNILSNGNIFLIAEAMLIGRKYGLDPDKLASILDASTGRNWLTRDWSKGRQFFEMYTQNINVTQLLIDIFRKDLGHAQQLAEEEDVVCPFLDLMVEMVNGFSSSDILSRWQSVVQ